MKRSHGGGAVDRGSGGETSPKNLVEDEAYGGGRCWWHRRPSELGAGWEGRGSILWKEHQRWAYQSMCYMEGRHVMHQSCDNHLQVLVLRAKMTCNLEGNRNPIGKIRTEHGSRLVAQTT